MKNFIIAVVFYVFGVLTPFGVMSFEKYRILDASYFDNILQIEQLNECVEASNNLSACYAVAWVELARRIREVCRRQ